MSNTRCVRAEVVAPVDFTLSERILCDLEMLLQGAFDPLEGFMTMKEYQGVVDNMKLPSGSLFPLPVVLPIPAKLFTPKSVAEKTGEAAPTQITLRDISGAVVAKVNVDCIYKPDLAYEQENVIGCTDENHPFNKYQNGEVEKHGDMYYVGGAVSSAGVGIRHFDHRELRRNAKDVRESIKARGLKRVVGFQTRNPMHRAHFELTVQSLGQVSTPEEPATLMLTPACGPTQQGDVDPDIRVECYKAILPYYKSIHGLEEPELVLLPLQMRMAGPREAMFHAIIRRNYGCTHFIVGRDHAGPSSKKKDGTSFYGPYDAHTLLTEKAENLGISCVMAKMMCYIEEEEGKEGRFVPLDAVPEGVKAQNVSGSEFRQMLEEYSDVPDFFTFPEVVNALRKYYRPKWERGLVMYFTGLPCSGKSTLANALEAALNARPEDTRKITVLDGDIVRLNLSKGLGFSAADRSANVRRIGYVASEIAKHGGICFAANIAPFIADRQANRALIESTGANYVEIYVETPLEVCEQRDVKEMYKKARAGVIKNFTGIDDPYEIPMLPEITVSTAEDLDVTVEKLVDFLKENKLVGC